MNLRNFIPALPFLVYSSSLLVGVIVLESGVYSNEIGQSGYFTGGSIRLGIYIVLSLCLYYLLFSRVVRKETRNIRAWEAKIILVMVGILAAVYAIPLLIYGGVFITGLSRYEYLDLPYVSAFNIKLLLAIMMFYVGITTRLSAYARASKIVFLIVLIEMVFWGEKVSGPLIAVVFYFCGLKIMDEKVKVRNILHLGAMIALIVVSLYFVMAGLIGGYTPGIVLEGLTQRIAKQGQVWWKIDQIENETEGEYFDKSVVDNLNYYEFDINDNPMGERYLKSRIISDSEREGHIGSFAGIYPAILYLNNGFPVMLVTALLLNILYFCMMVFMFLYSYRGFLVYVTPATAYFVSVHLKIFESGNIYLLTNPKYIFVAFMIFSYLIYKASKSGNNGYSQ